MWHLAILLRGRFFVFSVIARIAYAIISMTESVCFLDRRKTPKKVEKREAEVETLLFRRAFALFCVSAVARQAKQNLARHSHTPKTPNGL